MNVATRNTSVLVWQYFTHILVGMLPTTEHASIEGGGVRPLHVSLYIRVSASESFLNTMINFTITFAYSNSKFFFFYPDK
jgi:hypothetical protein